MTSHQITSKETDAGKMKDRKSTENINIIIDENVNRTFEMSPKKSQRELVKSGKALQNVKKPINDIDIYLSADELNSKDKNEKGNHNNKPKVYVIILKY